jgi:hypothetical protein
LRGNEEPHVYHMSRTSFQSILSLFFLFAPITKGGLPARRNEDRALMLPNRTLQIFLSVFFSLLTQETGRDYQREEMEITRMLPNRTSKSFFQSLFLCSHKKKVETSSARKSRWRSYVIKSHLQIILSFFSLCSYKKKGELPARGNQDRARSYQIALAIFLSVLFSLCSPNKRWTSSERK